MQGLPVLNSQPRISRIDTKRSIIVVGQGGNADTDPRVRLEQEQPARPHRHAGRQQVGEMALVVPAGGPGPGRQEDRN